MLLCIQLFFLLVLIRAPQIALALAVVAYSLLDKTLKFFHKLGVVLKQRLGCIATLCKFRAIIAVPRARLLYYVVFNTKVYNLANLRYALAKHNLELGLAEWRSHLVLDYLDTNLITYNLVAVLNARNLAYV